MKKSASRKNSPASTFRPEGELSIYTAAASKDQLLAVLQQGQPVEIDLSQVGEMDTAGLQLLILAKQEAQRRNLDMSIVGHSPAVVEALTLCNLSGFFGDPLVIPSQDGSRRKKS